MPDEAPRGGKVGEAFYIAELAGAENVECEFLDWRRRRTAWNQSGGQKFRLQGGGGVRFTRGHFLDGQANLAGKIALKLLGAEEAGNSAFGFHGAIEAAVHFVKKGLTGSQLRKQERTRIALHRCSADGNQRGEYGRGFSPACEIAVCCDGR